jgi:hypothetical protein
MEEEQWHAHRVLGRPGLVGAFVYYSHRVMPERYPCYDKNIHSIDSDSYIRRCSDIRSDAIRVRFVPLPYDCPACMERFPSILYRNSCI